LDTDLRKLRDSVDNADQVAISLQGEGGGKTAEATSDHEDVERPCFLRHLYKRQKYGLPLFDWAVEKEGRLRRDVTCKIEGIDDALKRLLALKT